MVEGAPAHPARLSGGGFERREEEVAARPRLVAPAGDVAVETGIARTAGPAIAGGPDLRVEDGIDRGPLLGARGGTDDVEVHGSRV